MIVIMWDNHTEKQIDRLVQEIEGAGDEAMVSRGQTKTTIHVLGSHRELTSERLESFPGVERVIRVVSPYRLAGRDYQKKDSEIKAGGLTVGGKKVAVIAGPGTVENRDQLLAVARQLKEAGADALRAGVYSPIDNPYAFQGMQEEGLKILAEARAETGLPIVVEATDTDNLDLVAKYADIVHLGSRNMGNYVFLKELGQIQKPVLFKRGMAATLDEFLLAAEYILAGGNPNVILCVRGIRTFEHHTRNTLVLTMIPVLKELTHLPVIVDPSHGTGNARYVRAMSRGAVAVGADGILVEVHQNPADAIIDGKQSITPVEFAKMMGELKPISIACGRDL